MNPKEMIYPRLVKGINGVVVYATGPGKKDESFDGVLVDVGQYPEMFTVGQKIEGWKLPCFLLFKGIIILGKEPETILKNIDI